MAVTTLRHIVDDIVKDFRQTFDDNQIQKSQVAYWWLMIANRLKMQHIGKRDSGAFLTTFRVPISVHASDLNPNEHKNRKHIILPKCIYDYDMDRGIEYMSYSIEDQQPNCPPPFTWVEIMRTTPGDSKRLYMSSYEKPSPKNPYFYRVSDHLYLLGIECVEVEYIEVGLYTTFDPVTEIDIDAAIQFPEELIIQATRQVIDLGRFVLMMPEQRVNDGNNTTDSSKVPTNKITSVNELIEDQPTNK